MIYQNSELLAKLTHLKLIGQGSNGKLEWTGTAQDYINACELEAKLRN